MERPVVDLDTDEAIVKLVVFIGACLSGSGLSASQIIERAKKLEKGLFEWIADDATGK